MFLFLRRKSISPLIATILLVVVAVVLVTILLNFGKDFTNLSLDKTTTSIDNLKDVSGFIYVTKTVGNLENNKIFIENKNNLHSFTFNKYKIIDVDSDYILNNKIITLEENITLEPGDIYDLNFPCFPSNRFDIYLFSEDEYFVKVSVNVDNYDSNNYCALEDGLVASWDFEDDVKDKSKNNNDGVIFGDAYFVDGKIGSALEFDGLEDGVAVDNDESLIVEYITISQWVKPYSYDIHYPIFVRKGDYYRTGLSAPDNGKVFFRVVVNEGEIKNLSSTNPVPIDDWTFIVATYDGKYLKIYINGVLDKISSSYPGKIQTSNTNLFIGCYDSGGSYNFDGVIDELKIYNKALNSQEINLLYQEGF